MTRDTRETRPGRWRRLRDLGRAPRCGPSGDLRTLSEGRLVAPSAICVLIAGPALLLDHVSPAVTLTQLVLGCGFTVHAARQRERLLARLAEVREVARITQEAIVRPLSRDLAGTHVSTRYHCAVRESAIGGDLYDVAVTPFGLRVLVGDVRGHGLETIRLTAETVAGFRELAHTVPDLPSLATGLDARLTPDLGPEDFVTALLAEFAPGEVRLVNCGHPAPLRSGERVELLEPAVSALPLGLRPDPLQYRVRLQPGDRLLLYTDGLTEARAPDGTLFPLLTEAAHALRDPLPDEALDTLYTRLVSHTVTPPTDDLALVLCQPTQVPAPAPAHQKAP
ncbi:PP2C family protein-serine/threonine phosphatase [Streptomyces ortus]|uniref:Serine/threonine-protein phosphatase n=1 Tax=Streptomyces ortus TaxID=2867268 RepID=A0ABT3V330_9ACTN|nr:PP2C family protein-serine/threonine phosphatase [Streptomyces ortus]MCX4233329.1 serine/threonine-protein phosphatase [Streptomyces ortus]